MKPSPVVLVLDDDALVVRAISRTLGLAGFVTRGCTSPNDAFAALAATPPDVIISDHLMPGMDGITFLREARLRSPAAARILCTGAEEFAIALEAINSGEVYRIIAKPWAPQELVSTVHAAAESVRLHRENERLTAEVHRQNARLREMNLDLERIVQQRSQALLEGLIAALDYRDAETQWHSRRVSLFARRLAQELGIEEPELTVIEHGALLHDVGKIGIRDSVLLKPGPLTPEEWVEMQRHAELGWALLQRVDHLRAASEIVLQHQERWDGAGYPAGLRNEQIGIGARIFHVVDTLDAITTDRPYRRARPYSAARAEMAAHSGTQFDPSVVDAFLRVPEQEWQRIRVDVETVAVLSNDLGRRAPAAGPLRGAV